MSELDGFLVEADPDALPPKAGKGSKNAYGVPIDAPGGGGLTYRMRGYDTDITSIVFWSAPIVDSDATYYGGVGPVTGIVVQKILGTE